jgi:hypothetical protein
MSTEVERSDSRGMESLNVPSPPLSAASSRSASRSPSYSSSGKRLSFRGHCVNVSLPETVPELGDCFDEDILERVDGISALDDEDVEPP